MNVDLIENKPKFITQDNLNYLTLMGSHAYGTATEKSDYDYYGFTIPPIEYVFPHTSGIVHGFGRQLKEFNQFQAQHLFFEFGEVDITVYSIV